MALSGSEAAGGAEPLRLVQHRRAQLSLVGFVEAGCRHGDANRADDRAPWAKHRGRDAGDVECLIFVGRVTALSDAVKILADGAAGRQPLSAQGSMPVCREHGVHVFGGQMSKNRASHGSPREGYLTM